MDATPFILIFVFYAAVLLALVAAVERSARLKRLLAANPVAYTLSLGIYTTAWTFYGIVGDAANNGFAYLTYYIGSIVGIFLWWWVLRQLIRFKNRHHITSIADFMGARYGKSHAVSSLVTVIAVIGSMPYLALQMKAFLASSAILLTGADGDLPMWHGHPLGLGMLVFMICFTIFAGIRRLDPTERHQGMVAVVALESVIKLAATLLVGLWVTYGLNDGFADIFDRAAEAGYGTLLIIGQKDSDLMRWMARLLMFVPATILMPRIFHMAVVENADEEHIRPAMWGFPLYLTTMTLFVMPIALTGLMLGMPAMLGDTFMLRLPLLHGKVWMAMFVFLGGISGGMSMIAINAMTLTTMITNELLLPLAGRFRSLGWVRKRILPLRWVVVTIYLACGYAMLLLVGQSHMLGALGGLAIMAWLQLASAGLLGLFWPRGNRAGALTGMLGGLAAWSYTMLVPVLARSHVLPLSIVSDGPFGILALRPEAFMGVAIPDPLAHTLFWSTLLNLGLYVAVSYATTPHDDEAAITRSLMAAFEESAAPDAPHTPANVLLAPKQQLLEATLGEYLTPEVARRYTQLALQQAGCADRALISVGELAAVLSEAERLLAGVIGTASAHTLLRKAAILTPAESATLSESYAALLAELNLPPAELRQRIDYYQEREKLLRAHAEELAVANATLRSEMEEREQAEAERREAEAKYRSIFENALEGIFRTTTSGQILDANPATARILGYSDPATLMASITDLRTQLYVDSEDRARFLDRLQHAGRVEHFETRFRKPDGAVVWVSMHARAIYDNNGQVLHIEGIVEDITSRKEAEDKLIAATRFVGDIIDAMPSVIIAVDVAGIITHWNNEAAMRYGRAATQVIGQPLADIVASARYAELARQARTADASRRLSPQMEELDGQQRWIEAIAYPLAKREGVVLRLDDVTSRVRMEEIMVQTEKMMSVGGLAAGMAHEINNPLGAILMGVQNLKRRLSPDRAANAEALQQSGCDPDALRHYLALREAPLLLDGIQTAGERAARIVTNMLEFSRRSEARFQETDLATVLDKSVELASNDYDLKKKFDFRTISIHRDYEEGVPPVLCMPTEIEQVLLNMLRNAAQAMAGADMQNRPPTIMLRLKKEAEYARMEVTDNGPGMPESVRRRVFEPFFTTKEVGTGTGLGLSVSYFIITENHGGHIAVDSRPGQGTTFTIRLPFVPPQGQAGV